MAIRRVDVEEVARRGQERYDREIRERVENEPGNRGKMLALDVDSGEYELGGDSVSALDRLHARRPRARAYIVRVGYPTAVTIGVGRRPIPGTRHP